MGHIGGIKCSKACPETVNQEGKSNVAMMEPGNKQDRLVFAPPIHSIALKHHPALQTPAPPTCISTGPSENVAEQDSLARHILVGGEGNRVDNRQVVGTLNVGARAEDANLAAEQQQVNAEFDASVQSGRVVAADLGAKESCVGADFLVVEVDIGVELGASSSIP